MPRTSNTLLAAIVVLISLSANHAFAGNLGKFEEDATKVRQHREYDRSDDDNTWWGNLANYFISGLVETPMQISWARVTGDANRLAELDCDLRKPGEPLLPFIRLDASYQAVESDVEAFDYRIQVGYGPIAFELNQTRYAEEEPSNQLDLYRLYGLFRLSYGNKIEVDLGLGGVVLQGNEKNSGFSTTLPILVHPCDWLIVEFRPMWSNMHGSDIEEYELGLLFNWDFAAIKTGYRWTHSPNESLDGLFIGLSIRY
jgi:hypothetical protein